MQHLKIGEHTITAWAEFLPSQRWHGLASIDPPIPNTWTGGPNGTSLVTDGEHQSERSAELQALDNAVAALQEHLRKP
jgi:hypothetical protein